MLNEFQQDCEQYLRDLLRSHEKEIVNREIIEGNEERYIVADISGSNITVYIFEDEALFADDETDYRFEAPDYDSSNELMHDFAKTVAEFVSRGSA